MSDPEEGSAKSGLMESDLRAVLDGLSVAVFVVDATGRPCYANAASVRLLGRGADEDVPAERLPEAYQAYVAGSRDLYPPERQPIVRALRGERDATADDLELRRGDVVIPLEIWAAPIVDAQGRITHAVASFRDVTERKRAEAESRLLQALAIEAHDARDLPSVLGGVLASLCRATGWALGEAWLPGPDGRTLHRATTWREQDPKLAEFETRTTELTFPRGVGLPGRVWESRRPGWMDDIGSNPQFSRAAAAREAGLRTAVAVPVLAGGEVVAVLGFFLRDEKPAEPRFLALAEAVGAQLGSLVRRRAAEDELARKAEALRRSNAELEQFAYVASHDLQEPLRMISSYVQLLARRYQGKLDADADEFIAFAVDGAARLQALINDLLAYSRVGTQGKPFEPCDAGGALQRALANLEVSVREAGATVTSGDLPRVHADATQLAQVFQNLVGNAIKFTRGRVPVVHVFAERADGAWSFGVRDNGIGIAAQDLERIFVIFQRLHTREEFPGTGIGLALCKKIIERHGGAIRVESEPGHGSTFRFTIPDPPQRGVA